MGAELFKNIPSKVDDLVRGIRIGRIGLPEDVAEAVIFLASEKSSFVTGEVMNVSGGFIV